jgi:hypothetical protein
MKTNTWLPRLALAALCATAACGEDNGPTAASPNPPAPTTETRWDIDVVVRYVRASGQSACDGDNIFGNVDPGEFQYRIVASYGATTRSTETNNYGLVSGVDEELNTGDIHNFPNETWTFNNLKSGEGVKLQMWVTEWDGTDKDDYMNNRTASLTIVPSTLLPSGGTRVDRALDVGTENCGLTLYHDVTVRTRVVNVE